MSSYEAHNLSKHNEISLA